MKVTPVANITKPAPNALHPWTVSADSVPGISLDMIINNPKPNKNKPESNCTIAQKVFMLQSS